MKLSFTCNQRKCNSPNTTLCLLWKGVAVRLNPFLISVSENRVIFVYSLITRLAFISCVGCQRSRVLEVVYSLFWWGVIWHLIKWKLGSGSEIAWTVKDQRLLYLGGCSEMGHPPLCSGARQGLQQSCQRELRSELLPGNLGEAVSDLRENTGEIITFQGVLLHSSYFLSTFVQASFQSCCFSHTFVTMLLPDASKGGFFYLIINNLYWLYHFLHREISTQKHPPHTPYKMV